jgi:lipopolysaccharide export system ATP-binding protein
MAADTAPASRLAANDMEPPEASHYERLKLTAPGPAAPPPLEVDGDLSGLVVDRVGKSFGGRQVVKDVSLTLRRGEVAGLLGPNGAGKTTCFYMITGLIAADYGAIYLDGEDITALPMYQRARAGLGYLPQETSIFRGMTVEQNVLAVVELREKRRREARDIATALLEELHIAHLRNAPAVSLSGGERRRVEIARALASDPAFMLLDEPFAGIDPLAIADIREVIHYLKGRGIGILITDHNVRETLEIIDTASIIHAGQVLFEGAPRDILSDPEVRRVYLGDRFD